jgi:hypothetical protein
MKLIVSDEPPTWQDYCFDHYYGDLLDQGAPVTLSGIVAFLTSEGTMRRLPIAEVLDALVTMVSLWTGPKWAP